MRRRPTRLAEEIRQYRKTREGAAVEAALRRLEADADVAAAFDRMTVVKRGMFRINPGLLLSNVMDAYSQAPLSTSERADATRTECKMRELLRSVDHLSTHFEEFVTGMRAILRTSETGRDVESRHVERLSVLAGMRDEFASTLELVQRRILGLGNKRSRSGDTMGAFQVLLNGYLKQDGMGSAYEFIGAVSACLYPSSDPLQVESIRKRQQRARRRARDSRAVVAHATKGGTVPAIQRP